MADRYEEPAPVTRPVYEAIMATGTEEARRSALVGLTLHGGHLDYVRDQCLRLIESESWQMRAVAATCLGHLARIHGRLGSDRVRPALRSLLDDPRTAGAAENALEDIAMFAG